MTEDTDHTVHIVHLGPSAVHAINEQSGMMLLLTEMLKFHTKLLVDNMDITGATDPGAGAFGEEYTTSSQL